MSPAALLSPPRCFLATLLLAFLTALPGFATASNPLDATGNAVYDVSVYEACMDALASDPGIALVAVAALRFKRLASE